MQPNTSLACEVENWGAGTTITGVLHQVEMARQSYRCLTQSTDVDFSGKGVTSLRRWSVSNEGQEEADSWGRPALLPAGQQYFLKGGLGGTSRVWGSGLMASKDEEWTTVSADRPTASSQPYTLYSQD